jgi:hypothetical protein
MRQLPGSKRIPYCSFSKNCGHAELYELLFTASLFTAAKYSKTDISVVLTEIT